MSDKIVTPENLTLADIAGWKGLQMREQMTQPGMREAVVALLQGRTRSEVDAATHVAQQLAPQPQVIAPAAPVAEVPVVPVVAAPVVPAAPRRFSVDYQITDEEGKPLGRPTHLEAESEETLREKMKEAHIQATRAFHRIKNQRITYKTPQQNAAAQIPALTDAQIAAAIEDSKNTDPTKAFAAQTALLQEDRRRAAVAEQKAKEELVSYQFLQRHARDYKPCAANQVVFTDYFKANQLDWTLDNLERAFLVLKDTELAPVEGPVVSIAPPTNTEPVITAAPPAAPQVVAQPVATVPAQVTAPVNQVVETPRPGVNGGIVPGQNSGSRPGAQDAPLTITMTEINKWDGKTLRDKMANPSIRPQIERAIADYNARKFGKS